MIGDFIWASDIAKDRKEKEKDQQEQFLYLMYEHQLYHKIIQEQKYALRGSTLGCSYGTSYSLLDLIQDHGIYKGNLPVLTTIDSGKSNICDFGACLCPESNYAGRLPMTEGIDKNGKTVRKASYNKYAHICIPMVPEGSVWKQLDHSIMAKTCAKGYAPMLVDSAVLVCQYGGIIRIIEVPQTGTTQESGDVAISPWLTGFQGNPTKAGGTSIDLKANARVQLGQKNKVETGIYGIDWYSYEPALNKNVVKQYSAAGKNLEIGPNSSGAYVNEGGRYWVAVGPEIATPGYNNKYPGQQGTLSEGHFKYGTEVDVVLKHIQTGEIVYVQTIVGDVKGHTYPDGVFQTGDPYPHSSNAGEDGSDHRNGSYIEFIGSPQNQNGSMSKYEVINIIVYGRSW